MALEAPPQWMVALFGRGVYQDFLRRVFAGLPEFVHTGGTGFLEFTSWYRTPFGNEAVAGDPFSQHLLALALDLKAEDQDRLVRRFKDLGLVAINEGSHVHVQKFPAGIVAPVVRFLRLVV